MSQRPRRKRRKRHIKIQQPSAARGRVKSRPAQHRFRDYQWKDISEIDGFRTRRRSAQLRLAADNDVPQGLLDELAKRKIRVESAEDRADDHGLVRWARKNRLMLLTFNHRDFLRQRKHPLQKSPCIIVVTVPNENWDAALPTLDDFFMFAKNFPSEWWRETRIRITEADFVVIKRVAGREKRYRVAQIGGRLRWLRA